MAKKVLIDKSKPVRKGTKRRRGKPPAKRERAVQRESAIRNPQSAIRNPQSAIPSAPVESVLLSKIISAPYNPRRDLQLGDAEWEKIAASLERFGNVGGLVWNKRTGHLVGGHQRLKILRHRQPKLKRVEVAVVDLADAQERELNVALNNVSGAWDELMLANVIADLTARDDADATATGFSDDEIQLQIQAAMAGLAGDDAEATESPGVKLDAAYGVLVTCKDEADQRAMYERMKKAGYKCRVLMI